MNNYPRVRYRLLLTDPADGATNMAIDETLLLSVAAGESPPMLRFFAWAPPCLSLGYAQPVEDVDLQRLAASGFGLVRRPTGGRAILHTDELTYSIITPQTDPRVAGGIVESYRRLSEGLVRGLSILGLRTRNDKAFTTESAEENTRNVTAHSSREASILSGVPVLREADGTQSKDAGRAREPHPSTTRQNSTAAPLRMLSAEQLPRNGSAISANCAVKENPVCFITSSNYEITADGKKLIGSAQARKHGMVLQHGSLPLTGDIARICEALVFENETAREAAKRQVRARATTLESALGRAVPWQEAAEAMKAGFAETLDLDLEPAPLSDAERAKAKELREERYNNHRLHELH